MIVQYKVLLKNKKGDLKSRFKVNTVSMQDNISLVQLDMNFCVLLFLQDVVVCLHVAAGGLGSGPHG